MPLTITKPEAAAAFKAALASHDYDTAGEQITALGMSEALATCLQYEKENPGEAHSLNIQLQIRGFGLSTVSFVVQVAQFGFIPAGQFPNVAKTEYDAARVFIMAARDAEKALTSQLWQGPEVNAQTKRFFPDETDPGLRQRIVDIARSHVNIGPGNLEQAALFGLGARFGLAEAKAATRPQKPGTTCLLVARSVWHAAGVNVINGKKTFVFVPGGPSGELPYEKFGYVKATPGTLPNPLPGDIFHIRGDDFEGGNDSTHVGIITAVNGDTWSTVEGGASDHITKTNERKLNPHPDGKDCAGLWAFENDTLTPVHRRAIRGWYSVDKISPARLIKS